MSFERIVGLEPAVRLLRGQFAQGRLAHTYLFTGPEGIGKRTLALELAKALNCEAGGSSDCECNPCRKIAEGIYPDVIAVAPLEEKSEISIDQVRDLERKLSLTPHSGQWKVGIVDQADSFTEEGMHGCLKLLEEPPPRSVIILISSAAYRLYATVISRSHVVRCAPQGVERVAAALREKAGLSADQARRLAVSAGGRMGLALQLQEGSLLAARNAALDQLLSALRRGEIEVPLGKVSREEVRENLEWCASWWRDLLVLSLGGDPAWVIHQDRLDVIASAAAGSAKQPLGELIDSLLDRVERAYAVHDAVGRNANLRNALAVLLSRHSGT
ncbi:MAG: DNA polymerase III subunit [Candidatus Omnitrophica bacterium]|nr:DNA polymerase III subunit [Candidatus Omnitrophota bacterium]